MPNYIPNAPDISEMTTGDTINYKGQSYGITSLGNYVNDGGGRGHRTVTLNDGHSTVITVSTKDTVCSSYNIPQNGTQVAVWSQSVNP